MHNDSSNDSRESLCTESLPLHREGVKTGVFSGSNAPEKDTPVKDKMCV